MTAPAVVGMPVTKSVCPATGVITTWSNVTLQRDSAGLLFLAFNGTDSNGVTPAIDFSGTDKMTLVAGIYKASDAVNYGIVAELGNRSVGLAGSMTLAAPAGAATPSLLFALEGTSGTDFTATSYAAPINLVVSSGMDIAGAARESELFPRVNGAIPTLAGGGAAASAGTGSFGNHPLYIGMRGGVSLPFNGRLYGLILRGAASTAGQIDDAERYMARLTGVNI